jgi:hypothetical protein
MPDQPSWIDRVPQILDALHSPDCPPFLDRPSVQKLFGDLSARQANRLMQRCHGYHVGRSVLVTRESLAAHVDQWNNTGAVQRELTRKQRLLSTLAIARTEARSRAIQIPTAAPAGWRHFDDLPNGIHLAPGELRIQYTGSTDLLQKLFALAQAIANDQQRFESLTTPPPASTP